MAPSRCTAAPLPAPDRLAAQALHHRLDQWAERVLASAIGKTAPVKWVVARVATDGLEFLMSAELAHFTRIPGNVIRYDHKADAGTAMARGYDVMKGEYGPKVAGMWWQGQRVVPVYHDVPDLP
jgi:hypothetical protein